MLVDPACRLGIRFFDVDGARLYVPERFRCRSFVGFVAARGLALGLKKLWGQRSCNQLRDSIERLVVLAYSRSSIQMRRWPSMRFMRKRVAGVANGFSMPKGRSKGWKRKPCSRAIFKLVGYTSS